MDIPNITTDKFEIVKMGSIRKETELARKFWTSYRKEASFAQKRRSGDILSNEIIRLIDDGSMPVNGSVLEFGCSAGQNLRTIKKALPEVTVSGIDFLEKAIKYGVEKYGLPLIHGDESTLSGIEDDAFDIVFTSSVLDHIPDIKRVTKELLRITKECFIAFEPYVEGVEGKVVGKFVAPASYLWDYPRLFDKLGWEVEQKVSYDKKTSRPLGKRYHLFTVKPKVMEETEGSEDVLQRSDSMFD